MSTFKSFLSAGNKQVQVTESRTIFPRADTVTLDPDRVDTFDIARRLMPTLTKVAFANIVRDRKLSRVDNEVTENELLDELSTVLTSLGEVLLNHRDARAFMDDQVQDAKHYLPSLKKSDNV